MRASDSPRDWALGAKLAFDEETEALSRAAEAAPDDALVQWLAANGAKRNDATSHSMAQAAAQRLVKLEPDNGAAWLIMLDLAYQRGDHAILADALGRMPASTRFDGHFGDALHAWLAIYDRNPPDDILVEASRTEGYRFSFYVAVTSAQAAAIPAFQPLFKACEDVRRSADIRLSCRDAARLMLHEGKTLIARKAGFGLLRKLGGDVLSDADRVMQRELEWYSWQGAEHAMGDSDTERQWNAAFEAAWRDQSSEIVAIQRALEQLGIPSEAPPGWTKPRNPWITPDS